MTALEKSSIALANSAPVAAGAMFARGGEARVSIDTFAARDIAAKWDVLAATASEPNAFAERWYLEAAQAALDAEGDVQLACVWAGERLIGLMPLVVHDRYAGLPIRSLQNWLTMPFWALHWLRRAKSGAFGTCCCARWMLIGMAACSFTLAAWR
jgi:hypothetical protein